MCIDTKNDGGSLLVWAMTLAKRPHSVLHVCKLLTWAQSLIKTRKAGGCGFEHFKHPTAGEGASCSVWILACCHEVILFLRI